MTSFIAPGHHSFSAKPKSNGEITLRLEFSFDVSPDMALAIASDVLRIASTLKPGYNPDLAIAAIASVTEATIEDIPNCIRNAVLASTGSKPLL